MPLSPRAPRLAHAQRHLSLRESLAQSRDHVRCA